jgi:alpha-glucosidase
MEYVFPHQGYERVKDQFLLGDRLLVAPVLEKNANQREVIFPTGTWKGADGKLYEGPSTTSIAVTYDDLCYFERVK